jgi:PHS family inorganic phosphate transporter-like MFS transporter
MDRIGRKPIQVVGFAAMAVTFLVIGVFHQITTAAFLSEFLAVYGLSYFFIEFGPNVTTFVYPPEVFPVSTRGLGSGIAAAGGKTGAAIGTVVDVYILATGGLSTLFLVLGALALVGLILTILLLPEPKQRDLEEVSQEGRFLSPVGPAGAASPKGGALPGSLLR